MMVARESVFNAILHGRAQEIEMEVAYLDDFLTLSVKDDGQGFDASKAFSDGHFGLRGMRERIQQLGGKFEIQSTPERGTHVHAKIPRLTLAP
jgi:signal transduction histidine kinase